MDEFIGLMHSMQDNRDFNEYFISEAWLNSSIPDTAVKPPDLLCSELTVSVKTYRKEKEGDFVFSLTRPGA